MKEKKITKIEALSKLPKKTRVAAYARVSNAKDAMLHSLYAQINYYKKVIQDNKDWQFVGVYASSHRNQRLERRVSATSRRFQSWKN